MIVPLSPATAAPRPVTVPADDLARLVADSSRTLAAALRGWANLYLQLRAAQDRIAELELQLAQARGATAGASHAHNRSQYNPMR